MRLVLWWSGSQFRPALYCGPEKCSVHLCVDETLASLPLLRNVHCADPFRPKLLLCRAPRNTVWHDGELQNCPNRKEVERMALKKRGKTWHTHFFVDGQRFRQSLGTSDWRGRHRRKKRNSWPELSGKACAFDSTVFQAHLRRKRGRRPWQRAARSSRSAKRADGAGATETTLRSVRIESKCIGSPSSRNGADLRGRSERCQCRETRRLTWNSESCEAL